MGLIAKTKVVLILLITVISIEAVQAQESGFHKGMCFVTWEKERYASTYADRSLGLLAQTGAEWVAIITTCYQDKYNSQRIFTTEKTPSDRSLIHAINKAHCLGLKVMLKPHLDLLGQSDGLWRADIGFQSREDWQKWFVEYLKFILHYAKIAAETKVELFCIGTELSFAAQQTEFWQGYIIPRIRNVYSGKLVYAANWDEYRSIRFWNDLDFVGIDAYFPLTQKTSTGYEEIEEAWRRWADEIELWQKTIGKSIIFTEIGYRSCEFSATRPWDSAFSGKVDLEIQSNSYKAALSILFNRSWCKGMYWWYWKTSPYAGGLNNRDFTPQNKPSQEILVSWYRGLSLAQLPSKSISQK